MKKKIIVFLGVLILCLGGALGFFLQQPRVILADSVSGNIRPYAKKLVKSLNRQLTGRFGERYILYTANFEKNSYVPMLKNGGRKSILWLGSAQNYIPDLDRFDFILASSSELNNFLKQNGDKSYYFPLFTDYLSIKKKKPTFMAIVGNPPFIEDILKERSLPYRKYDLAHSEELLDDVRKIQAVFAEDGSFSDVSIDLHPMFLALAAQKVPLVTQWQGWKTVGTLLLFNDSINYYIGKEDAAAVVSKLQQKALPNDITKRVEDARHLVERAFSLERAEESLLTILQKRKEPVLPVEQNSLNFDLPVTVGHTAAGDFWLATDLADYFHKQDFQTSFTFLNSSHRPQTAVNILMRGMLNMPAPKSGDINIYYLMYPQLAEETSAKVIEDKEAYYQNVMASLKGYDAVATASESLAKELTERGLKTYYIPQYTQPKRFYPAYDDEVKSEILFVGRNAPYRRAAKIAVEHKLPITIYGPDWADMAKGEFINNNDLYKYYSSAKIVLNDTRQEMLVHGVISNRIFDATACGTLVISDYMPEIEAVYGDSVPMWKSEKELVNLLKYYLDPAHEEERLEKAKRAQEITLKNFTVEQAAERFGTLITEAKKAKGL